MASRNLLESMRGSSCAAAALTSTSSWPASLWVSLRAYWRFCRENPQQSGGNTCFVFFNKTTAVLAGGTGAIQRQQVMAGGGPLPQAPRHLLAPARIWALNSSSAKSWQMLKRQRPRSKARLLLQEESGWQTASHPCAWGREGGRGCRQSSRPGCSQSSSDLVVRPLAGPGLESATARSCKSRQGCLHEHPSNPPCRACITQPSPTEKRLIFPAQPARTKTSMQFQNERRKSFLPSCK